VARHSSSAIGVKTVSPIDAAMSASRDQQYSYNHDISKLVVSGGKNKVLAARLSFSSWLPRQVRFRTLSEPHRQHGQCECSLCLLTAMNSRFSNTDMTGTQRMLRLRVIVTAGYCDFCSS
jgi:hypothetical protein